MRLNPRGRRVLEATSSLRAGLAALEHAAVQVRGICRDLADLAEAIEERGQAEPEILMALGRLLVELGEGVAAFGELVAPDVAGPPREAGENPAVGSVNGGLHRKAMAKLDWLVVRDLVEVESATFWRDGPEIQTGELQTEEIGTEVFLLPAAAHTEKDGSFTNTQRLLQWHHTAIEPPGDARSDLWFYYHLGRIIRDRLATSTDPKDRPVLDLAWDYPTEGPLAEPSAEAVLLDDDSVRAAYLGGR